MDRNDIYIISRFSNLTEGGIDKLLKDNVYADSKSLKGFLNLLCITLGLGFAISGIIFFFAYNWADLHKFAKIGLIEGLIVLLMGTVLFTKQNQSIKNILLTASSVLVGVLFAVFGQIYQTGANAYDFFLGWTLSITLWVVISNYAALWLLFIVLINTTFVLYSEQVASNWSNMFVFATQFVLLVLVLVATHLISIYRSSFKIPKWFTSIIAVAAIWFATIGVINGLFEDFENSFLVLLLLIIISYSAGLIYSFRTKKMFYLSIIPFSIIIIISAFLIKISEEAGMFLSVSIFIIISITFLIRGLLYTQKKWNNEK